MNGNKKTNTTFYSMATAFARSLNRKRCATLLGAFFVLLSLNLSGQTIVCTGTPAGPLSVAVDDNCNAVLTADQLLEGSVPAGPIIITVYNPLGNVVADGPEPVTVPGDYLGQLMSATVTHQPSGNSCTSYFVMHDALVPVFTANCDDVDVSCNADTSPGSIGYPTVIDNCDGANVTLTYSDVLVGPNCAMAPPYIGQIVRTWFALDASGNQSECTQIINLLKESVNSVQFPADYFFECSDAIDLDPAVTGEPTIDGNGLMSGVYCMINASYSDNIVYLCLPSTASYEVLRTWTVLDNCTNEVITYTQHIMVHDTTDPIITCPPPLVMGTNSATCSADFLLPEPTVSDNCTATDDLVITAVGSWGGSGFGPFFGVAAGSYTVTYQVTDLCGNSSFCQVDLDVVDDDVPTAICDEFTVVTVPASGLAVVAASNLDDGSYDNCAPIEFTASRDAGVTYNTYLEFDCEDIGQQVEVIVRVSEVGNPASYSECTVQVDVQDNSDPLVSCPVTTLTIQCDDDYSDLSVYGDPIVVDGCAADVTMAEDSTFNINNCGEGVIIRTWTFTDAGNNTSSCQQTISVVNDNPYDGSSIVWPQDYTLYNACIDQEELHPDSLPASYARPGLPSEPCALLGTNYSDQYFYVSYPACYKIMRTWAVMDWCSFDPENPTAGGIWYHTQIIEVKDNTAPSLTIPDDVTVGIDNNCEGAQVSLPAAFATDCSPYVTITNDSPYADGDGADASGFYPLGTTTVLFTATDGCGNTTYATMEVTVRDLQAPGIICVDNIITELGYTPDTIMVDLPVSLLVVQGFDNCTATADLKYFLRRSDPNHDPVGPPSDTVLTFYCSDQGYNEVEIWVVDLEGNADYCTTNVIIQDNFVVCPPTGPLVATVAGLIEDEDGTEADGIEVHVYNDDPNMPDLMDEGSPFVFEELETGYGYTVMPEKNTDPLNGVTSYDLVLISRHILGIDLLDSPYKLIAADANKSGTVSTLDVVLIQKVILTIEEDFGDNTSWRFVPADYVFSNPDNPWEDDFPEWIYYPSLDEDQMHSDFIAIKVGDVNGSAQTNSNIPPVDMNNEGVLPFQATDVVLKAGNNYAVAVRARDFNEVAAFQFTLNYNPQVLQLERIEPGVLQDLNANNFNMARLAEGLLTGAWHQAQGLTLEDESELFVLHLKALQSGMRLSEVMGINSALTKAEAYRSTGERMDLSLEYLYEGDDALASQNGLKLQQNIPNPFRDETQIGFYLPQGGNTTLSIFDMSGRVLYREVHHLPKGQNTWMVRSDQLEGEGVYYYRVETATETATGKMILMK